MKNQAGMVARHCLVTVRSPKTPNAAMIDDCDRYWIEPGNNDCQVAGPGAGCSGVAPRDLLLAVDPRGRAAAAADADEGLMRGSADDGFGLSALAAAMASGLDMAPFGASRCCNTGNCGAPFSAASKVRFGP